MEDQPRTVETSTSLESDRKELTLRNLLYNRLVSPDVIVVVTFVRVTATLFVLLLNAFSIVWIESIISASSCGVAAG